MTREEADRWVARGLAARLYSQRIVTRTGAIIRIYDGKVLPVR